jgi:lipid II:glycine glycyltransferase (peptidoglycan interpeptide bridge formation enzyme)
MPAPSSEHEVQHLVRLARAPQQRMPTGGAADLGDLRSETSSSTHDARWDDFVATTPGGYYMQTTAWARLKAGFDWSTTRVVVVRGAEVVAGAQVLLRRVPVGGTIGWVPRGPLLAVSEPAVVALLLDQLLDSARRRRTRVLMVQPAAFDPLVETAMEDRGFRPTPVIMSPSSTVVLDLTRSLDDILAAMAKNTRRNVRKGLRDGVRVRVGGADDLRTFYELHAGTSQRQGFSAYPVEYFERLWEAFRPQGGCQVLLADVGGGVVSGMFVLAHGDTVYALATGWNGQHGDRKPNDVLHWEFVRWAKEQGYRHCDLVWIDPRAGDAVTRGLPLPEDLEKTATAFKLRLGGRVVQVPRGYELVPNPALRLIYHALLPQLYRFVRVKDWLFGLRWRWFGAGTAVQVDD